jgi:hypothetical protein
MPRVRNPKQTRRAILQAAYENIHRQGFQVAVSVTNDMSGLGNMWSVRFYSVSQRGIADETDRTVTRDTDDEV